MPSREPSIDPTPQPSPLPSPYPTDYPSESPTPEPTKVQTDNPTSNPSGSPSMIPTSTPSSSPSMQPTSENPTLGPTLSSLSPTAQPTPGPTTFPTMSPIPTTAQPSDNPSMTPSHITSEPTSSPSIDPTSDPSIDPTNYPTLSPTPDIQDCSANGETKFCVYEAIHPEINTATWTHDIVLTQPDLGVETKWEIYITVQGEDCIQPDLTVYYEGIDYDTSSIEYFDVTNSDGSLLVTCSGSAYACDSYELCAANLDLQKQKIGKNHTHMIGLGLSEGVDALCTQHDLAMNVILRLACNQAASTVPTQAPTMEPSQSPTTPTANPTPNPTNPPICGITSSGATIVAYDIDYQYFTLTQSYANITFDSCTSGFDTYLYFQTSSGSTIFSCDDCGDCGSRTILTVYNVDPGDYRIGVGGFSTRYGSWNLTVTCVPDIVTTGIPSNHPTNAVPSTSSPSIDPTISPIPVPTKSPSPFPSLSPSEITVDPTESPSFLPTKAPTDNPTSAPTQPTMSPTFDIKGAITCDSTIHGETTSADNFHYYSFRNPAHTSVIISSCHNTTFDNSDMYFFRSDGNIYQGSDKCDDSFEGFGKFRYPWMPNATYIFGITGYSASDYGTYTISTWCGDPFNIFSLPTSEPSPEPTMAPINYTYTPTTSPTLFPITDTVNCGSRVDGATTSTDKWNYYSFTNPEPNSTVFISTCYPTTNFDTNVGLLDLDGIQIASAWTGPSDCRANGNFHARLELQNLDQGSYFISVGDYSWGDYGSYTMSVICAPKLEEPVTCGSTVNGITTSYYDWDNYTFINPTDNNTMIISSCYNTTFEGADIYLFDSTGSQVAQNGWGFADRCYDGFKGELVLTGLASGNYTLGITNNYHSHYGPYTITVSCGGPVPESKITCGSIIHGQTWGTDNFHYYTFINPASNNYVTISSCDSATIFNSDLYLYDSTGAQIAYNDVGQDFACAFQGELDISNLDEGSYTVGIT